MTGLRIAVLGLGEAGSTLAAQLAGSGDEVHGYDPAAAPTPEGVSRHRDPGEAVAGADLVIALTPGSESQNALTAVLEFVAEGSTYADLATSSPSRKRELAAIAAGRGISFVDVALMAPIPGRGIAVPSLASGDGAEHYAEVMNARGGRVEVVSDQPGEAASHKLLRSVVMKGLAALLIESMAAGAALGKDEWLWDHLVDQLTSLDETLLDRLLFDTAPHATRRVEEMEAAEQMLHDLGVSADMTGGTLDWLRRLADGGMPEIGSAR